MGSVYSMISNIKLLTMTSVNSKKNNKYEKKESNNSINKLKPALGGLNLKYKVYSPESKEEYDKFYETMMGMFRVDKNGKKKIPKYTYEEGINKIFN